MGTSHTRVTVSGALKTSAVPAPPWRVAQLAAEFTSEFGSDLRRLTGFLSSVDNRAVKLSSGPLAVALRGGDGRIGPVDAARGVAMLVVFLAHFADAFYGPHPRHHLFIMITRMASPAFVWLSGMMLGVLHCRHKERFADTRDALIDRGLFLLLVGHPLLMGAFLLRSSFADTWRVLFITDTLGVCLIVGSLLITSLGVRARLALGAACLLGAWLLILFWWPPAGSQAWWFKDILTADWKADGFAYKFPLLPWFGLYLMGSSAGSVLAARIGDPAFRARLRLRALGIALVSIAAAVGVRALLRALARLSGAREYGPALQQLASLTEKLPPGPGYVLFYGGLALLLFWAVMVLDRISWGRAFSRWSALFGRCSLACFVVQFYVYYVAVYHLPHPPEVLAPLYFAATLVPLRLFARTWDRHGWNRAITVGYRRLARAWRHDPRIAPRPAA